MDAPPPPPPDGWRESLYALAERAARLAPLVGAVRVLVVMETEETPVVLAVALGAGAGDHP